MVYSLLDEGKSTLPEIFMVPLFVITAATPIKSPPMFIVPELVMAPPAVTLPVPDVVNVPVLLKEVEPLLVVVRLATVADDPDVEEYVPPCTVNAPDTLSVPPCRANSDWLFISSVPVTLMDPPVLTYIFTPLPVKSVLPEKLSDPPLLIVTDPADHQVRELAPRVIAWLITITSPFPGVPFGDQFVVVVHAPEAAEVNVAAKEVRTRNPARSISKAEALAFI